ncbi:hypothetical protein GCM10028803_50150 [Larkinella knui]
MKEIVHCYFSKYTQKYDTILLQKTLFIEIQFTSYLFRTSINYCKVLFFISYLQYYSGETGNKDIELQKLSVMT